MVKIVHGYVICKLYHEHFKNHMQLYTFCIKYAFTKTTLSKMKTNLFDFTGLFNIYDQLWKMEYNVHIRKKNTIRLRVKAISKENGKKSRCNWVRIKNFEKQKSNKTHIVVQCVQIFHVKFNFPLFQCHIKLQCLMQVTITSCQIYISNFMNMQRLKYSWIYSVLFAMKISGLGSLPG